jgi:hypothetical protein
MPHIEELVEQHIREHESRLKHIDELLLHARKSTGPEQSESDAELEKLIAQRGELAGLLEKMRLRPSNDWQEKEIELAGPMGIWDAVAQQLEKLVERLER